MFASPSGHLTLTSRQSPPLRCRGRSLMNYVSLTTTAGRWAHVNTCPALTTPPVSCPVSRKTTAPAANQVRESQRGRVRRGSLHQSVTKRKERRSLQDTLAHQTHRPRPHKCRPYHLSTGRPTGRRTGGKPATLRPPHRPTGVQTRASSPRQSSGPL